MGGVGRATPFLPYQRDHHSLSASCAWGKPIIVYAQIVADEAKIVRARAAIEDEDGTVLASSEGVFSPVPKEVHEQMVPLLKMPGRSAELADI
ncbi:MAG: hypothetical protein GY906_04515 [bacterium]|nr:hypothetical protein [bacterium]